MPAIVLKRKVQVIMNDEVIHEEEEKEYNAMARAHHLDRDFRTAFMRHNGIEIYVAIVQQSQMNKQRFWCGNDWYDELIKTKVLNQNEYNA